MSTRTVAAVALVGMTLSSTAAFAASAAGAASTAGSAERVRQFSKLPNWYGLWEADNKAAAAGTTNAPVGYADVSRLRLAAKPPYNAEWEARVQKAIADKSGKPPLVRCSFGYPAMMDGPAMFQMFVLPEETVFLFHGDDTRHVYTDGRKHPTGDDLWPTPLGDSVGRWEGDTLVIDTVARKAGPMHLNPYYVISDKAHFTERVRMTGPDTLQDMMTVDDPVAFSKPLQVTLTYKRVKDLDRMIYSDCTENDRNPIVDGKVTFSPDDTK